MLSLAEDRQTISDIFKAYLNETPILKWRYEEAVSKVAAQDLMCTNVSNDIQTLGDIYKELVENFPSSSHGRSVEEEAKIEATLDILDQIVSAPQIKKLMFKCLYKRNLQSEVLDELNEEEEKKAREEAEKKEKKKAEAKYPSMTSLEKFDHLAKYHGTEGTLDLNDVTLPRRYKDITSMKSELKINLQPLVTLQERDLLVEVSKCKKQSDVEDLLATLYQKKDLSSNCRYIRFALAAAHEVWSTNLLKKKGHGEDWYRLHIYSNIWDKAFLLDDDFETKRSECISKITTALREIDGYTKLQKVDFILRDINTDSDFLSVEEKPSKKGVKADLKKGSTLQKQALQLWSKKTRSISLIGDLEAVSCQWEGLKLITFASRLLPSGRILSYTKSVTTMPVDYKHCPAFAKLLMHVLTIKRLVIQNYEKFNAILNEKYRQEIETLRFNEEVPSDHISERSDSTQPIPKALDDNNEVSNEDDDDANNKILGILKNMKFGDDIKSYSDWEDLLLHDRRKRRRIDHEQ